MQSNGDSFEQLTTGFELVNQLQNTTYQYNQRECVYASDMVKLYHYQPLQKKLHSTPVLVTFATVNRPEVLDLFPERSFIHGLLEQGLDVYLVDWGYPTQQHQQITLDDYICKYLRGCIDYIKQHHQTPAINLIGICQGGVMSICHAALQKDVEKLVLISTPIDFQTADNKIYHHLKNIDINMLVSLSGNVPGAWLTSFFISLRPFELIGEKFLKFADRLSDTAWTERFIRMEKWLHDAPDQTAASFSQFINDFYMQNRLIHDQLQIDGKHVSLRQLNMPILNIVAEEDEIIPPSASLALRHHIDKKNYNEQTYASGHIGIYVSDKIGLTMPENIAVWLKK